MNTKRLRVFAGPNGSGKTTLVRHVSEKYNLQFGYFVNADVIEKSVRETGRFDASTTGLEFSKTDFLAAARLSGLHQKADMAAWLKTVEIEASQFIFPKNIKITSYHAALLAEYLREKFLASGQSFTMETVLSDARKLDLLEIARALDYRVYLYFVATEHPGINLARVRARVEAGGHDVASDKVFSRYDRSLGLLPRVVRFTDRAFIFDNSVQLKWVAEITDGRDLTLKNGGLPGWVQRSLNF